MGENFVEKNAQNFGFGLDCDLIFSLKLQQKTISLSKSMNFQATEKCNMP